MARNTLERRDDWRRHEREINDSLPQFTADIGCISGFCHNLNRPISGTLQLQVNEVGRRDLVTALKSRDLNVVFHQKFAQTGEAWYSLR